MRGDWKFFLRRAGAYLVDIVVLFAVLGPLGWLLQRAFGFAPTTGREIWWTLLLNFSLPVWVYFTVADASVAGATLGKRWLGLRVSRRHGGQLHRLQALNRTAAKLLPWELVHISAFAFEERAGEFSVAQGVGLTVANVLVLVYVLCAAFTGGRRSVHDFIAATEVETA